MACVPPPALKALGQGTSWAHFSFKLSIWVFESSLIDEGMEAMGDLPGSHMPGRRQPWVWSPEPKSSPSSLVL